MSSPLADDIRFTIRNSNVGLAISYFVRANSNSRKRWAGWLRDDGTLTLRDPHPFLHIVDAQNAIDLYNLKEKAKTVSNLNINGQLCGIIDNGIQDFVQNQVMFTAYDLTFKLRSENPGIQLYHSAVKQYVHEKFESGNGPFATLYQRCLTPITQPEPFLYYLPGVHDPADYKGLNAKATVPSPTKAPTAVNPLPGGAAESPTLVTATFKGLRRAGC